MNNNYAEVRVAGEINEDKIYAMGVGLKENKLHIVFYIDNKNHDIKTMETLRTHIEEDMPEKDQLLLFTDNGIKATMSSLLNKWGLSLIEGDSNIKMYYQEDWWK